MVDEGSKGAEGFRSRVAVVLFVKGGSGGRGLEVSGVGIWAWGVPSQAESLY